MPRSTTNAILKLFVSEANLWMVQNHGISLGYNFFHHIGLDATCATYSRATSTARTEEFIALYDNPAFDAQGETLTIGEFEPMVRRVFAQPRQSIYKAALDTQGA